MERTITVLCALLIVVVAAAAAMQIVFSPMGARRASLEDQLAKISPVDVEFERRDLDVDSVQKKLASKPGLWVELLAPPPPPPPPPPKPPNLEEMAKGVAFGRQQVGDKVKMTKAGETKGSFVGVGDAVNGLTVKEITKTSVVLALKWQSQELTISKGRK